MKYPGSLTTFIAVGVLGALLAATSPAAGADPRTEAKPTALRGIMQELGRNMLAITGGISREDWALVARIAPLIADHPQPPLAEKMRILGFIGADAGKFKSHDQKTHRAAQALERAATRQDGPAVISGFATLQASCLACHQEFRQPFKAHFNAAR